MHVKRQGTKLSASHHKIYFLLQRAAHILKTQTDTALGDAGGLTTAQAAVMTIIVSSQPVTQKQIAIALSQRESAVASMALRLLKAGYITRSRSESDGRAWELNATEAGCEAMQLMQAQFDAFNVRIDNCLPDGNMEVLAAGLANIIDEFDR